MSKIDEFLGFHHAQDHSGFANANGGSYRAVLVQEAANIQTAIDNKKADIQNIEANIKDIEDNQIPASIQAYKKHKDDFDRDSAEAYKDYKFRQGAPLIRNHLEKTLSYFREECIKKEKCKGQNQPAYASRYTTYYNDALDFYRRMQQAQSQRANLENDIDDFNDDIDVINDEIVQLEDQLAAKNQTITNYDTSIKNLIDNGVDPEVAEDTVSDDFEKQDNNTNGEPSFFEENKVAIIVGVLLVGGLLFYGLRKK